VSSHIVFSLPSLLYNRDICGATDSDNNEGWAILKAIFYYTCDPSGIEILFYCIYWVVASVFIAFKLR
jgi:high-affinity Fe2+/Pb2+ permease